MAMGDWLSTKTCSAFKSERLIVGLFFQAVKSMHVNDEDFTVLHGSVSTDLKGLMGSMADKNT